MHQTRSESPCDEVLKLFFIIFLYCNKCNENIFAGPLFNEISGQDEIDVYIPILKEGFDKY